MPYFVMIVFHIFLKQVIGWIGKSKLSPGIRMRLC